MPLLRNRRVIASRVAVTSNSKETFVLREIHLHERQRMLAPNAMRGRGTGQNACGAMAAAARLSQNVICKIPFSTQIYQLVNKRSWRSWLVGGNLPSDLIYRVKSCKVEHRIRVVHATHSLRFIKSEPTSTAMMKALVSGKAELRRRLSHWRSLLPRGSEGLGCAGLPGREGNELFDQWEGTEEIAGEVGGLTESESIDLVELAFLRSKTDRPLKHEECCTASMEELDEEAREAVQMEFATCRSHLARRGLPTKVTHVVLTLWDPNIHIATAILVNMFLLHVIQVKVNMAILGTTVSINIPIWL
ncbi:hypothetical protein K439DRAFT_1543514 [Ramaria rubella]|nr:hypothetical protein K439DRAFT_1543514 [Ramaria rubella]